MDNQNNSQTTTTTDTVTTIPCPPKVRGFAALDPAVHSEISRKGGQAVHAMGRAHRFTSEEARAAGRKGGRSTHAKRQAALVGQ